ncbi:MAG: hypothetical protein L6V82_06525 [Clostridiales bacterium]|nr:MAG: hypothetical protein L6V82_06525 [Clostridiales bacterium]
MKKLSRLLLVLTLVLLIGCTSVLLVACDDGTDQGPAPTTPSFRVSFMKLSRIRRRRRGFHQRHGATGQNGQRV